MASTVESVAVSGSGRQTIRVDDIMSRPALTVPASAAAREALDKMRQWKVQHLVVVDAQGRAAGVITDGDLRAAEPSRMLIPEQATREKALSLVRVGDVMTPRPYTVTADMPIAHVLQRMRETKVGSIPVLDAEERPVGIVTGFDVLELALRLLR
jgi:CBS domain-containing protein